MAIVINGSGTITGISAGGLPDGSVDADTLATDSVTAAKLKSDAITAGDLPSGSVLQVVSTQYQTQVHTNSTSFVNTGLSLSITPSSTSSKILVMVSQSVSPVTSGAAGWAECQVFRDSTSIEADHRLNGYGQYLHSNWVVNILDSPATTGSVTYKTMGKSSTTAYYIDFQHGSLRPSTMTLMEIAG